MRDRVYTLTEDDMDDENVEAVRRKLLQRAERGMEKYGVPTDRAGLTQDEWLRHLQEELLDAAVYIEAALGRKP